MAEYEDAIEDLWLVQIVVPNMRDVTIARAVKFEDLPETIRRIRQLMPGLRVTSRNVTQTLAALNRDGFKQE